MTKNYSISQLAKTISMAFSLGLATLVWTGCKDNDDPDPCASLKATATAKTYKLFVTPQGGVAPYTYSIGGSFQSDSTFSITEAKEYTVSVKDANACTATSKLTVTSDMLLGECKGFEVTATAEAYELFVTPTGGTAPYSYSIDGTTFQADSTFDITTAKEYTITVKDKSNCSNTYKLNVTSNMLTSFKDKRDNQTYKVVKIGDQIWMAENLNYNTNKNDSTSSWYYNDDETTYKPYGKLYTWYVAVNGAAPKGWHIPSKEEWKPIVENYTNEQLLEGGSSGMNFKKGGLRNFAGVYHEMDVTFKYLAADEYSDISAVAVINNLDQNYKYPEFSTARKAGGSSIRCLKD